jgi:glycosyltransferase involved in cell wall biosynthesis
VANNPAPGRGQPRLRHNDYTGLPVAELGGWHPHLPVSVVVPAFGGQHKLDLTLASLAAQSYPGGLLEVVVVDDTSTPPLTLPDLRPERTRLIRPAAPHWGSAHAVHCGVRACDGAVILRLDSDMVVHREHIEAHLRWHHLADYLAVMGTLTFTPFAEGELGPEEVYKAVHDGAAATLFPAETAAENWTAQVIRDSRGLLDPRRMPFRVATGATVSWSRSLYHAAGGMDRSLLLGGDTEFGYRMAQAGAVFVPESEARSWHLGLSQMKSRPEEGRRYRAAHLGHRIPLYRHWRQEPGRQWQVPYVEVVVEAGDAGYEPVHATVTGALASTLPDVGVTVVAPWSALTGQDRAVLDDPRLDLRLIRAAFGRDGRVALRDAVPPTSAPAPFRFRCPAGLVPTADGLRRLTELAEREMLGLVQLAVERDGGLLVARLERTAAVARASRLRAEGEELDHLVDELFGSYWLDGTEWALAAGGGVPPARSVPQLQADHDRWRDLAAARESELDRYREESTRLRRGRGAADRFAALRRWVARGKGRR